jgi:tRNA-dihydrouridine synthase 3
VKTIQTREITTNEPHRYLINPSEVKADGLRAMPDDDAAEGRGNHDGRADDRSAKGKWGKGGRQKQKGQNKERTFGNSNDIIQLCHSRAYTDEFSPRNCKWGENCRLCHDLRKYLKEGKRGDLETFDGKCTVFEVYGCCPSGWRCRFVKSHMQEIEREDGRQELVLIGKASDSTISPTDDGDLDAAAEDLSEPTPAEPQTGETKIKEPYAEAAVSREDKINAPKTTPDDERPEEAESEQVANDILQDAHDRIATDETEGKPGKRSEEKADDDYDDGARPGLHNRLSPTIKRDLLRKKVNMEKAVKYCDWLNSVGRLADIYDTRRKQQVISNNQDIRAQFTDPPFKPSEKRRLYFGSETPVLAPLTTQGNIPFRRLCVDLGAQLTYSEMAMGLPLLQGGKADWTLMRAHESEVAPPKVTPNSTNIVQGYDNQYDLRFGAQIQANQPWVATKVAYILEKFVPKLRLIDLNCGCPIDMVYKTGGGSGLLEHHGKMERMIRGMNAMSGEIPITAKLRTGIRNNRPQAASIIGKLAFGTRETRDVLGAPGCAAITLHGRSREQRYTKKADWGYIAECAAMIKSYNEKKDELTDTAKEPDESTLPNNKDGRMFFIGNGDCYSHVDYYNDIETSKVDSVMIGRGALLKPWIFEEIEKGQYIDKSATERLDYIEKFIRYGLEAWGTDELGLGLTRRFLLEWLSFTCRYVPLGILEHLPPNLNDRPPTYRGRDDLETLMASDNYKDWIKIRYDKPQFALFAFGL